VIIAPSIIRSSVRAQAVIATLRLVLRMVS
jgi:hypothetical protein